MSLEMSASSFSTLRERSSVPEASRAGEPSGTLCRRLRQPRLGPSSPPSLARRFWPSENPADSSPHIATTGRSLLAVKAPVGDEGRFFYSHPSTKARHSQAILGPLGRHP